MRIRLIAALALVLACAVPVAWTGRTALAQEPSAADIDIDVAPVEIDGTVLFHVRGASSLAAETRARNIRARIEAIAGDASIATASLRAREDDGMTWIGAGDRPIMAVIDADARLEQLTRAELAMAHVARIRQAIDDYRQARRPEVVQRGLRDTAGALLVFVVSVAFVLLVTRWLRSRIERWVTRRIEAAGMLSIGMPRAERVAGIVRHALLLVSSLVLVVMVIQFLGFTFGRFPQTRRLSNTLVALLVDPFVSMGRAVIDQVPNLAFLAVLVVVLRLVLKILRLVFDGLERRAVELPSFEPEWAQPTYKIVRFAVIAFGLVVAYPYLPGSETAAFKGVSLFVGVLFSLGSTSAISNLVAGYVLIYRRAFRVGDWVKIGDVVGEVTASTIQVTRVRSFKNEEVVVPNSLILGSQVLNYTALARSRGLILHTVAGIGYETPWRQVEAMLLTAAERTPGILREPKPFVLQLALADFAVNYELNVYCADASRMLEVYSDLHRHIQDVFNEFGVQIMTPAYMADPAVPKVVPPGQWYAAPASPPPSHPDGQN